MKNGKKIKGIIEKKPDFKISSNSTTHPSRNEYPSTIIQKSSPSIHFCLRDDCENVNEGKCSTKPFAIIKNENNLITDCLRFTAKGVSRKIDVLAVFSDIND
jgi:hypothetical protein